MKINRWKMAFFVGIMVSLLIRGEVCAKEAGLFPGVAVTLSDEIAEKEINAKWTVTAHEVGKEDVRESVKTGDDSQAEVYLGILVVCAVVIGVLRHKRKYL